MFEADRRSLGEPVKATIDMVLEARERRGLLLGPARMLPLGSDKNWAGKKLDTRTMAGWPGGTLRRRVGVEDDDDGEKEQVSGKGKRA